MKKNIFILRSKTKIFDFFVITVILAVWNAGNVSRAADEQEKTIANLSDSQKLYQLPIRSWKSRRDEGVIKQKLDYSCGAASMATILNLVYGQNLTEEDLLKAIDKGNGRASFYDMAQALSGFGFRARGYAASWEQLILLKIPVIVYLKFRANDHFSVLRGISGDTVWLADPSLGNRTFSRAQFLAMWDTRGGESRPDLLGKFLVILPEQDGAQVSTDVFARNPVRQSAAAVDSLRNLDNPR